MGLFSKKKKIDAPPLMDVPSPVSISSDNNQNQFGEPDIPPIPSSNSNNIISKSDMDDAPLPNINDLDVPLPPSPEELKLTNHKNNQPIQEDNENLDNDLPPLPPEENNQETIPSMNESSPLFPSMDEEKKETDGIPKPSNLSNRLPFEHSYSDMPGEQELKETFAPKSTSSRPQLMIHHEKHHAIPNYDQLLDPKISNPSRPHVFDNKDYFLSLAEYKDLMGNLNDVDILTGNQIDTTSRLTSIQDEKNTRYDKYQHELELIHNHFAKLDTLIFN
jgi:hypothetical protein